jgi:nitrite reductase/ring-hydroxylating ferredoxin subunit
MSEMPQIQQGQSSKIRNAPRNQWYVVAGREEIGRTILTRRMLDQPLVLYRTESGKPVAFPDRCPHRLMALSKGKLIGDDLECPYHGFRYGPQGNCTKIPTQGAIPSAMSVRSFPIVEKGYWAWIWMGDDDKAGSEPIPDGHVKDHHHKTFSFTYPVQGNYMRLHENLLDTSHPSFLHAGAFDDGDLAESTFKVEEEGRIVRLTRQSRHPVVPGPSTIKTFGLEPGKAVTRTLISESHAPNLSTIINRFTYVDEPNSPVVEMVNEFPISPGGPKLCYQFWSTATNFPMVIDEGVNAYFKSIMAQDDFAIQSIETNLDACPDAFEVSVRADEAAVRFRRIVMQLVASETA